MFCDGCGAALLPDQAFCGRCGKEVKPQLHVAYPRPSRVAQHVRLLGILWLAYSALHAIGGIVLFILANTFFLHMREFGGPHDLGFLHPLLSFIGVLLLVKAAAGVAAGWGLLQREPWARILALVVAFVSLLNVPIGTVLGIYTLWVLLPAQSDREYEEQARAA